LTFRKPEHSIFHGHHGDGGTLILVRGCPGSGKSTLARSLSTFHPPVLVHIEADMYFEREGNGYQFNIDDLNRAHRWCLDTAKIMLMTRGNCCVSNTFTRFSEMADYVMFALGMDITVEVYTLTSEFQNQHNVPDDKLKQMRERFWDHDRVMKQIEELYRAEYQPR
jgi:adenylate kinase family enzyme